MSVNNTENNNFELENISSDIDISTNKDNSSDTNISNNDIYNLYSSNNNNIYGTFYSNNKQIIKPNNKILFEHNNILSNIVFNKKTKNIKIKFSGIYMILFKCQLETPGQIALYINDYINKNTITYNDKYIIINDILKINKGDVLSFKNIYNNNIITETPNISGMLPDSQNLSLTIYSISSNL